MSKQPWDVIQARITRLQDQVRALPSIREATVIDDDPLTIRFDTDTTGTVPYATTIPSLTTEDRVLAVRLRHYIWVIGKRL